VRRLLTLAILALTPLFAQEPSGGPTQLIITYRCPPPRRAAFRQYMTELGVGRFERWKQEGLLKDYRFLFNWYVDVDTWDAMAVLWFPNYAAVARWKDVEKTSPGGLARDALDMAWPLNTYSVDVVAHEAAADPPADLAHAVYFIVAYDFATPGAFRDFARTTIGPQAKALQREGVLAESTFFANRYPGGKRWQGLSVLVFKDLDAFARREEVMAKASNSNLLATNPAREPVIAESVGPIH